MKDIKHLMTAALIMIGAASFAQHRQQQSDPITSHSSVLNLTADQKSILDSLNKSHRNTMMQLKMNDSVGSDLRQQQVQQLQQQHREQSLAVLTPGQVTILEKISQDQQSPKNRQMDPKRMQKQLNLTEDQSAKLKAMHEKNEQELKQVRQDSSITEANKKIRMEELKKVRKQELESILTPEQQKKFKQMRGPRGKTSASE